MTRPKITRLVRMTSNESTYNEHLIKDGWALVRVIEGSQIAVTRQTMLSNSSYNEPSKYQVFQGVVNDPIFVFEKDAEADSIEQQLREENGALASSAEQIAKELNQTKGNLEQVSKAFEHEKTTRLALAEENRKLQEQLTKIKADAEKLKRFVGQDRWTAIGLEILGD